MKKDIEIKYDNKQEINKHENDKDIEAIYDKEMIEHNDNNYVT